MRDQREDALTAAKALGRMAEQFIGAAPRDGQRRRAERDRAVDVMRDGEKVLIEMVEASRRDEIELRQLRARLNSASPQAKEEQPC